MSKNILVLTGSPRKGGNSDQLADAFIAGARLAGHTVQKYTTADKTIKGCMACNTCFSQGTACSIPDDFNELAPLVEQADMIVFATPLYFFSFSAHLKAAMDRFYAFLIGQKAMQKKGCALLACAADKNESCFDSLVVSYKRIAGYLEWKDSGMILVPGLVAKEDILKTDGLKRAEELGKNVL